MIDSCEEKLNRTTTYVVEHVWTAEVNSVAVITAKCLLSVRWVDRIVAVISESIRLNHPVHPVYTYVLPVYVHTYRVRVVNNFRREQQVAARPALNDDRLRSTSQIRSKP